MSDLVLDVNSIVTIIGDNGFVGNQGVVMDMTSDFEPEDGLIAVFFDTEVSDYHFVGSRKFVHPTPDNYKECPRIICFEKEEVEVVEEFSLEVRAKRLYPMGFWISRSWKFPLIPSSHACQFGDCKSDLLATEKTLVNIWGTIFEVYACTECHKERNGMLGEILGLKDPLPGVPEK